MPQSVLVTGGAGFIGSHLVDHLVAAGHHVRVFDDFSTGQLDNLAHHGSKVEIVKGCLTRLDEVTAAANGTAVIYHLGAMASVAKSLEDPLLCHAICGTGTLNVLEAARKAGTKRVVYAASSSAYGSASDPAGQDEETPLVPLSPYAAAKLTGEHYLQAYAASFGVETVRLRFFNIFGPRQRADSPYSGVIAIFANAMKLGKPITVHGDGLQARDFTFVANAVQAVMKAGSVPGVSGRVYNVGTAQCVNLLELVSALNRVLGTNVVPLHGATRAGDVKFSRAKIAKIVDELGYVPSVDFDAGLRQTIQ
ncbi:NAD-dependent epimerase/dehydratase family protein [soil metagenome]